MAFSFGYLSAVGISDDNVRALLRWSARAAFLTFLVVFMARPLRQLYKTPISAWLLRHRRLIGVAFAGLHSGHLLLIFYRAQLSDEFVLSVARNGLGAFVYLLIFAMFATSFNSTTRWLGPRKWKILHTAGLYVIFVAFAQREIPRSLETADTANWTLTALALIALSLRAVNGIRLLRQ